MKNTKALIEVVGFALALVWVVILFSIFACISVHADALTLAQYPKQPAPLCAGVMCVEVR